VPTRRERTVGAIYAARRFLAHLNTELNTAGRFVAWNFAAAALDIGQHFTNYFTTDHSSVGWQWAHIDQF